MHDAGGRCSSAPVGREERGPVRRCSSGAASSTRCSTRSSTRRRRRSSPRPAGRGPSPSPPTWPAAARTSSSAATRWASRPTSCTSAGSTPPRSTRRTYEAAVNEAKAEDRAKDHEVVVAAGGLHIIGTRLKDVKLRFVERFQHRLYDDADLRDRTARWMRRELIWMARNETLPERGFGPRCAPRRRPARRPRLAAEPGAWSLLAGQPRRPARGRLRGRGPAQTQGAPWRPTSDAMKVAILAGGVGTRIPEETEVKPKPMVEIGGRPILWHIMKHLRRTTASRLRGRARLQGRGASSATCSTTRRCTATSRVACGTARRARTATATARTGRSTSSTPARHARPAAASSGSRRYLGDGTFMLTWGDGVSDVDLARPARVPPRARQAGDADGRAAAGAFRPHRARGRPDLASSRRSRSSARAGSTAPSSCSSRQVFDYIEGDDTAWEREPLERLATRRPADGLPPRRLLAVHGHAARQEAARGALGLGQRALEGVELDARPRHRP